VRVPCGGVALFERSKTLPGRYFGVLCFSCARTSTGRGRLGDAAADDAGIGQRFDDDVKPGCSPGALVPLPGRRAVGMVERMVERMREVQQQWGMRDPSLSISDDNSLPPPR
jgi:hypothetical protein